MHHLRLLLSCTLVIILLHNRAHAQASKPITITVDIDKKEGKLQNMWAYFGYDEPNYTYMKDGKKLLSELAALSPQPVYVRTHNLLTTGDGKAALKWGSTNAYTEDANGKPVYDWRIVDSIFDTYIKRGMKPIAEIGFMPEALSSHPQPYRHYWKPGAPYKEIYTGWSYPPGDYAKWGELVYQWVKHCVARYGEQEVNTWWWEVWNEPNIDYWNVRREDQLNEYLKLYDYAVDAVKRACPDTRVGGPTSTGPSWDYAEKFLKDFLVHCASGTNNATGKTGSPLDYVSFHAKGSPKLVDGHVRMNMGTQLNDVAKGCAALAASPFKKLPIIIGECDPEGCAACGMATNPENAYRNGTMYSSYTAASFARIYDIAKHYDVNIEGAVSWSFEFEDQPWFYGFRDLATNGIDKPVLNVFRMYGKMNGDRITVENPVAIGFDSIIKKGVREANDIGALATADNKSVATMIWNYHDDDVKGDATEVVLHFKNIPSAKVKAVLYRIDSANSNAYEVWKSMGSPQSVSDAQYKQLEKAGQLNEVTIVKSAKVIDGAYVYKVSLPRQGVYLVKLFYGK